ncbi:uncharacterized protein LOC116340564 [Contarinia nasturtii]|uniref:uncharacterized protein LOC116340564 n=1 Tax=Contarinia nasturtii TaxID=265458 RepID=UPI0012D39AA4|nr:uncharacterized protein LOC116340564 [Contarinia nasturtii]
MDTILSLIDAMGIIIHKYDFGFILGSLKPEITLEKTEKFGLLVLTIVIIAYLSPKSTCSTLGVYKRVTTFYLRRHSFASRISSRKNINIIADIGETTNCSRLKTV